MIKQKSLNFQFYTPQLINRRSRKGNLKTHKRNLKIQRLITQNSNKLKNLTNINNNGSMQLKQKRKWFC